MNLSECYLESSVQDTPPRFTMRGDLQADGLLVGAGEGRLELNCESHDGQERK